MEVHHSFPRGESETRWREFLTRADYATHYIAPEFFLEPFFTGRNPFAIVVSCDDRVMAVLTGINHNRRIQAGVSGRPQIGVDPGAGPELISALFDVLRSEARDAELITVVTWSPCDQIRSAGFTEKKFDEVVMLDLSIGPEAVYKQFNKGRKSDITFATRHGVVIREATTQQEFDEYYRIYVLWSQRKGLEIQSLETMRNALALRSNRRLFLAIHEERIIAGSIMRYVPGGIAEYSANSSIDEALALKPNALLVWSGIQWACAEGLRKFSMGAAHPFLRHFGGVVLPLYRYRRDQTVLRRHDFSEWSMGMLRRARSSLRKTGVAERKEA